MAESRLALAVAAATMTVTAIAAPGLMTVDTPTVRYSAIVRFDTPGSPSLIDDAAHGSVGMRNPRCLNGMLVLDFPKEGRILGATAQADETLVAVGIAAGVSVGTDRVLVRFARASTVIPCESAELSRPWANLWLSAELEKVVVR